MHTEDEETVKILNSKTMKITILPRTPAHSHVVSTSRGRRLTHKRRRGVPKCRTSSKTRQGSAATPRPRTGPLTQLSAGRAKVRRPAPRRRWAQGLGDGRGKGEAGGRGTSPARHRKALAYETADDLQPRAPTCASKGPGTGPPRVQPAAPRPFFKRLAPRPHPSPPGAPRPACPKPLPWATAARVSVCWMWGRGCQPRPEGQGAGLSYLHFPPPCRVLPVMGRHLAC